MIWRDHEVRLTVRGGPERPAKARSVEDTSPGDASQFSRAKLCRMEEKARSASPAPGGPLALLARQTRSRDGRRRDYRFVGVRFACLNALRYRGGRGVTSAGEPIV